MMKHYDTDSVIYPESDYLVPHQVPDNKEQQHVVILGAGPAGLTSAYELNVHNHIPVTVLEKDLYYVGGISRTVEYKGYRFDIGGHRFFSKSQEIEDLWTEILGSDMLIRPRLSRILYGGKYFDYPLKATNALFNLGPIETIRCLASYLAARNHPVQNPRSFEDWVSNQFGYRLYSIFFKTYTEKVWGMSTKELSADWAAQRIKGLNLVEAIKGAILPQRNKSNGAAIKTLIEEFRYPKHGPGEMWERVQQILISRGQSVLLDQNVITLHHDGSRIMAVTTRTGNGVARKISGSDFISTLPIRELIHSFEPSLPEVIQQAADQLKYRDYLTVAIIINRSDVFPDNWIYLHDPEVKAGRIQNYKNWSPTMVPDDQTTCLGLEYFCFENDNFWSMSDADLVQLASSELVQLGFCSHEEVIDGIVVRQPKAYPVYDDTYKEHLHVIRNYLEQHFPNLQLVGRNGMHHYNNQDHSMMTALCAARNIATHTNLDPWNVNTDAEYHEGVRDQDDHTGRMVPQRVPSPLS
jgi:protoporphyrinogen oxidase